MPLKGGWIGRVASPTDPSTPLGAQVPEPRARTCAARDGARGDAHKSRRCSCLPLTRSSGRRDAQKSPTAQHAKRPRRSLRRLWTDPAAVAKLAVAAKAAVSVVAARAAVGSEAEATAAAGSVVAGAGKRWRGWRRAGRRRCGRRRSRWWRRGRRRRGRRRRGRRRRRGENSEVVT